MAPKMMYYLASQARFKLSLESSSKHEPDLRRILGHVNLLEQLTLELDKLVYERRVDEGRIGNAEESWESDEQGLSDDSEGSQGSDSSDTTETSDLCQAPVCEDGLCGGGNSGSNAWMTSSDDLQLRYKNLPVDGIAFNPIDTRNCKDLNDSDNYGLSNLEIDSVRYPSDHNLTLEMVGSISAVHGCDSQYYTDIPVRRKPPEIDLSAYHW